MTYSSKWKSLPADRAVAVMVDAVRELGLDVREGRETVSNGCHALTLMVGGYLFVNGKGVSSALCRASAYGELIERIATRALFRLRHVSHDDDGEVFLPDEVVVDAKRYGADDVARRPLGIEVPYRTACALQGTFSSASRLVAEPFTSVADPGRTRLHPISITDLVYGTNGMAYGSTREEAQVQALSEVLERHATVLALTRSKGLPPFPLEELDADLVAMIRRFESEHSLRIRVLDAAQDLGLPVVCVIAEHGADGRYFVKFGGHFDPSVAAERCLTELFQGRGLENLSFLKGRHWVDDPTWQEKNLDAVLHTGDGYYPETFLSGAPAHPHAPWPVYASNTTAARAFETLLEGLGDGVWYREYPAPVGFVVRYLVPGVSEICTDVAAKIAWRLGLERTRTLLSEVDVRPDADLQEAMDFIESNTSSDMGALTAFLHHDLPASDPSRLLTLHLLRAVASVRTGDVAGARTLAASYRRRSEADPRVARALDAAVETSAAAATPSERRRSAEPLTRDLFHLETLRRGSPCSVRCRCRAVDRALESVRRARTSTWAA